MHPELDGHTLDIVHSLTYVLITDVCQDDWTYFKGYCYRKVSSCDSWNESQQTCTALEANLPSIHSQEENVYVQSLHGGEHSWLGLSDIKSEGTFVWSDGTLFDFHYWAKHQPNNFHNEDCVHTLGFLQDHTYEWNDINCTDCHRFTCKRGNVPIANKTTTILWISFRRSKQDKYN